MEQKRPSIPIQVQAFRRRHRRPRWPWALTAALVAYYVIERRSLPANSAMRAYNSG